MSSDITPMQVKEIADACADKVVQRLLSLDKSESDTWREIAYNLFVHLDALARAIHEGAENTQPCQGCYGALEAYARKAIPSE